MLNNCIPFNKTIHFSINIILHVCILFTIISLFFIFIASKIVKSHLEDGLEGTIKDGMSKALNKLSPEDKLRMKATLSSIPLDNLIALYSKPDEGTEVYNKWLFNVVWIIIVGLVVVLLTTTLTAYGMCSKVPIGEIIFENISIFLLVGIVEATFFWFIALKYIPVPPSAMIKSILGALKKNIQFEYMYGVIIGSLCFLAGVMSIENVFYRPNENGHMVFTLDGFIGYLSAPFDKDKMLLMWGLLPNMSLLDRLKMLNINWVAMIGLGCLVDFFH